MGGMRPPEGMMRGDDSYKSRPLRPPQSHIVGQDMELFRIVRD